MVLAAFLSPRVSLHGRVPLEKSADALKERSREVLRRLGYPEKPADTASVFAANFGYLHYVEENDSSPLVPLLILAGLAIYGFWTALAGRPIFGTLKLEE